MRISDWSSDVCSSDLPSYDYFRIYRKDDICRVHSDRPSCEHSVSLTLAYSDDLPWPLEVGSVRVDGEGPCFEDFGDEPFSAIEMKPGDAVLYRGIDLRHGRTQPNPNHWSRSEEHTSELQSLMRNSYAGFCLKKK